MPQDDRQDDVQSGDQDDKSKEELELFPLNRASAERHDPINGSLGPESQSKGSVAAKRQSSLTYPALDGQPRAPRKMNRVRFAIDTPASNSDAVLPNGHSIGSPKWLDGEENDDDNDEDGYDSQGEGDTEHQQAPLLTGITSPADSPFLSDSFQPEDHLPNARPTSGLRSAFMNMANSIIGAAIVGQPYAVRQAGLTTGILLMIGLTIMVDWTIRLIVVNSKLSGADSFQATVQHCFGRAGLIAISLTQWVFAFGGMVAFCVVVGDTIPPVLRAVIPGLSDMRILWLLSNRRFVIVLFVMGICWPLSLYRDIAKVSH